MFLGMRINRASFLSLVLISIIILSYPGKYLNPFEKHSRAITSLDAFHNLEWKNPCFAREEVIQLKNYESNFLGLLSII